MDYITRITDLIFLHLRNKTSRDEEDEIAAWRKESLENEQLYFALIGGDRAISLMLKKLEEKKKKDELLRTVVSNMYEKLNMVFSDLEDETLFELFGLVRSPFNREKSIW